MDIKEANIKIDKRSEIYELFTITKGLDVQIRNR